MSGRRESGLNHHPFSRNVPIKVAKRTILVLCEGLTELDYLKSVKRNQIFKQFVDIRPIDKYGPCRDMTNRDFMIELVKGYQIYHTTKKLTLRYFITHIVNEYAKNFEKNSMDYFEKEFIDVCEILKNCISSQVLYNRYMNDERLVEDGFVINAMGLATEIIRDCNLELGKDIDFYTPSQDSSFGGDSLDCKDLDSYVIFDRDFDEYYSTADDYDRWIRLCEDMGVNPVISSPCFELWLYMHWENNNYGHPSHLPEYAKDLKRKIIKNEHPNWSEEAVDDYVMNKRDKRLGFRMKFYDERILHAIKESKRYPNKFYTDIKLLRENPGTMMGDFLESLLH